MFQANIEQMYIIKYKSVLSSDIIKKENLFYFSIHEITLIYCTKMGADKLTKR